MNDFLPSKELWTQSSAISGYDIQELDFLIYKENFPQGKENYAIFLVESLNEGSLLTASRR